MVKLDMENQVLTNTQNLIFPIPVQKSGGWGIYWPIELKSTEREVD